MRIAIFSPNMSRKCSGGAETYALYLANVLSQKHDITIFTSANYKKNFSMNQIYDKYGAGHYKTKYVNYISTSHEKIMEIIDLLLVPMRHKIAKEYDLFINVACNRVVAPKGIPAIHIIHFPCRNFFDYYPAFIAKRLNRRYLNSYVMFLPNSYFTKYYFEEYWGKEGRVLYPPLTINGITDADVVHKEDIIIAVSRLVPDKKIMEMIRVFKKLVSRAKSYKFVIIGAPNYKYESYYHQICDSIRGFPIEVHSDVSNAELSEWYKKSKIFWHAKGYGIENSDPMDMEHFGMVTVEAMINGCVPVVIDKAGQKEIVENFSQGYRWNTLDELCEYTERLINNEAILAQMRENARKRASEFSLADFEKKLTQFVEESVNIYRLKH